MNFKNKKNVLNDKMREKLGGTFCPQENFSKHMFYDGTHLNTEGTSQLVSNYKYMIGKSIIGEHIRRMPTKSSKKRLRHTDRGLH